ncbi:phasin [Pseudaminobacter sp. 19-2017]|uniref:Phasin n=1 Tax=Pseudaminobacter soli (ex Zhang et al. 2022) TaxID=2831468 RepID=A0A942I2I6_9HYPH|nr:phasin [Pseudaminobacter soli]MBS3648439.1 phasin [Pseudaminobacter soli]
MSKTASKPTEFTSNVEYPAFDASKATDQFRAFAEKGMEQSKEVYSRLKSGAESTQKALESTFETARAASTDLSLKTIAAMRANTELGLSHLEALAGAKSMSELIELQTSFVRKSVENGVAQAKDLQTASTKAYEDVSKPMRDVFEKAVNELKVA